MKARISRSSSRIVLSIGMIVKNEEKHLEKCLAALKPLLDAVPSELVVVDTGSTDRTVEIAKLYTDKIFHFDWINDFSAARNFGLEKCAGEWFMFLDADEYFDDLSEMIAFFKNPQAMQKYNSAAYMIRSYTKPDKSEWSDTAITRIARRTPGLHFVNPIHECFNEIPAPRYSLRTFVNHWGYAHLTKEEREAKQRRNLPLLEKELEKKPNDMRLQFLILNERFTADWDAAIPAVLEKARENKEQFYSSVLFLRAILFYTARNDSGKALNYIDEYFKLFKTENAFLLDIYASKAALLNNKGDLNGAIKAFEAYFKYYKQYKAGKLDASCLNTAFETFYHRKEHYEQFKAFYEELVLKQGRIQTQSITLSIGMIVKNEEKHLEKCLAALKPLLDAVPSELVIVDTGSTDRTVEIARNYTDKIFHFDWIDDFSAARNFGLEKCAGEWFMFLDADEYFDDLSEMIAFFKNPQAMQKYNSAAYIRKDYTAPDGSQYTNFTVDRIIKMFSGLHFINPIHEGFSEFPAPCLHLKTFVHHWGYAHETEEQQNNKKQRNLSLLYKELEKAPDDLRIYLHILNDIDSAERERLLPEVIEKARRQLKSESVWWAAVVFLRIINYHYKRKELDTAERYTNEYLGVFKNKQENLLLLEFYALRGEVLTEQGKHGEAVKSFNEYFRLYKQHTLNKLDTTGLGAMQLAYCEPEMHEKIKQLCNELKTLTEKPKMKTLSYNYNKNIILSVSMIVKNEEKMLGACLDGLKPLLDAVPSELVIVDTGSTDRTVEIAKLYTDKIFHFDWINDFSAARNFGLEKCSGMWFMFLDADDHFQDVSEMIEFFNDEKIHKNYNTAFYITRNFTSAAYNDYFNFYAHRITRKTDELHFEGAIHEYFIPHYNPAYYFKSYAYHYGYAFESEEAKRNKEQRNFTLLEKELEKDPDNLRTIFHTIGSMVDLNDKKRELIERGIKLSDKSENIYSYVVYFCAFEVYAADGETEKAFAVLDKVKAKVKPDNGVLTEVYGSEGRLLYLLKKYTAAEQSIKKYLDYLDRLEDGKLEKEVFTALPANYSAPEKRGGFINLLALCINAQNRPEDALAVYDGTDFAAFSPADFISTADTMLAISANKAAYPKLVSLYARVLGTGDSDKAALFEQMLEKIYFRDSAFAESFKETKGKFTELMQICAAEDTAALESFVNNSDTELPEGFSAAVMLAIKHNINLSGAVSKMNLELMRAHLAAIAQNNAELPLQVISYQNDEFFCSSIKALLFGVLLFEAACFNSDALALPQRSELYNCLINYSSLYAANVYNPALLNEEDIGALPESHRFGYFMGAAKNLLDAGNKLGYIKELKKALASCKSMQKIIKLKIEEFSL